MLTVTTSRKPGRKTRRFAKVIARYFNWNYVNRGKMSLEDLASLSENFCIISEVKGNPAYMTFYQHGEEKIRIRFTTSNIKKIKMDSRPTVFIGKPPADPLVFGAIPQNKAGMKLSRKVDFPKKVIVKGRDMHLYYRGELVVSMRNVVEVI